MAHQKSFRVGIKPLLCFVAAATLLGLGGSHALTSAFRQEEEDEMRRLWNKQFLNARVQAKKPKPNAQSQTAKAKPPATVRPQAKPGVVGDKTVDGELIGVTIWRLRQAAAGDNRMLVQKEGGASSQYALERVKADDHFKEGQFLRISIEAPRVNKNYLYVIDREIYDNGAMSEPSLIFPSRTTPSGANVITAGRSVYVPAMGDPIPYFTLERSSKNHVGELLTIIISPEPLPVNVEQPNLNPFLIEKWEKQWGGQTEKRESRGGAGKQWTKEEQEADEGKRKLVQSDPLPQTIYRVRAKRGGCALVSIPLQIAQ
ncbi:MAG: hypothetical protein ACREA2_09840 [Blastocatellia bacterium]